MMTRKYLLGLALLSVFFGTGCGAFEDPTPTDIFFRLSGEAGTEVEVIFSTQFVAGVDEFGVTGVQVFSSDTVRATLPVDTVVNIAIDRQFFVMVLPPEEGVLNVDVIIDVDDRNLISETGGIFAGTPWNFVYMFNRQLTRIIEVEI